MSRPGARRAARPITEAGPRSPLTRVAAALAWLVLVAPGAALTLLTDAAPSSEGAGWRPHRRRGLGPRPRLSAARIATVALLAAAVALGGARLTRPSPPAPQVAGADFWPPAFTAEPHGRALWDQMATLPEHVADAQLGWRNAPEASAPLISIRDGVRVTRPPGAPADMVVWVFGGSTAYGVGQRDQGTIASHLVTRAAADGVAVEVVNMGVSGYVAWQEALLFERALTDGTRPTPDVAIFYHRSNDLNAVCRRISEGLHPDEPLAGIEVSDRFELSPPTSVRPGAPCTSRIAEAAGALADQVQSAMDDARRVAADRGIEVVEAWQPDAWTVAPTEAHSPTLTRFVMDPAGRRAMAEIVDRARRQVRPTPADLSDALDAAPRTVLFDWNHTNELGAQLVADRLWPLISTAAGGAP